MTAISSPTREPLGARAQLSAPVNRTGAFTAAQRHSRRVRMLRFTVPALGALSVVVVLAGWWYSTAQVPELSITDVSITDEGIAMDAPVLRGEDDEGRPYELRAAEAFQSLSVNPVVLMRQLVGEITLDDDEQAVLTAPQARYDSDSQQVSFEEGDVSVTLTSGASARLGVSQVDLEMGTLVSQEPVQIANNEVQLDAGGIQVFDSGDRFVFTNGVRMVFTPTQTGSADTDAQQATDTDDRL